MSVQLDPTTPTPTRPSQNPTMFAIFSDRLGCAGSIAVSIVLSVALTLLVRSCAQ